MDPQDPSASNLVGRTIGSYRVEAHVGAGGMGEVYRARDSKLDRLVALKLLPRELAGDPERFRRFHQEARAASSLNHPHILVVHDIGESDGRPFIVTELVEGETLRQRMVGRSIAVREAIDIGTQVASALAAAHGRGIVHRDIKPENIMVRPDGYVKVLDFGLAKLSIHADGEERATLSTDPGMILGTPEYMSPEQAAGEDVDFRSDQFSFGVVMYELLSGRRPFQRRTAVLSAAAVITDIPEPLARLRPDLPPPLWWAIERCLAKRKDDRYRTTDELQRDLATIQGRISDARPPAAALPPANLPAAATSLVGRDADAVAIRTLLERTDVRWVTLTGPGGVGKTRLAVHVARAMSDAFAGATYFVPLAGLADADHLVSSLAAMLDVRTGAGEDGWQAVTRHLRALGVPMLFVLDNFEHVTAAAVQVAELLDRCESVKLVASSRARLNISAEHEYQVSPLTIPDARQVRCAADVADVPAVRLFVERAQAARAGFALTDDNAGAVARICLALDGLPLAIELAAARVKVIPPEALLARVAGKSLSLDGGARDRPARQQTLRATIDWGYELLTTAEQRLFRRLAVFISGWTLEGAEAVCDARQDLGIDVFDGVSSLIDKSLVRAVDGEHAEPRFTMLSTIREYALERLASAGEAEQTRQAHAAYYLVLAEDSGAAGPSQAKWLATCEAEHPNLRAAMDYVVGARLANWAMRLGNALLPYWQARARLPEGRDALSRALALSADDEASSIRARALFSLATIVYAMGDSRLCETLSEQALAIYRTLGDQHGQAIALNALAVTYHSLQRYDDARRAFGDAVPIWRALGLEEASVRTLANLASVALDAGDVEGAIELYRDTRAQCDRAGDAAGAAWAMNGEARVEHLRSAPAAATTLYEEALRRFEQIEDGWGQGDSLLALGLIAGEAGQASIALERLTRALSIFRRVGDIRGSLRIVEAAAHLAARACQAERALTLAGAAAAARHTLATPLPRLQQERLEKTLDAARRGLAPQQAGAAWMHGWSLSVDEAVSLAFGPAGPE